MRRRRKVAEAAHHERWLVSYADFMTLLFALFVVLFASSHHDKATLPKLSSAIKGALQEMGTFSENRSTQGAASPGMSKVVGEMDISAGDAQATPGSSTNDLAQLEKKLQRALGKEIERQEVVLRVTPEGFVISLHELGFFDSGQARLLPGASDKIKRIAAVLMESGLDLRVEGHTDNIPIHNAAFSSNWDLSTARASAVAMMLLEDSGFNPQRLSIAGYGQYHPVTSNDTLEGRKVNRRVDLIVVSFSKHAGVKAP